MAEPPLINKSSPSSSSSLPPPTSPPSFSSNAVSAAIAAAVLPTTMEGNGGWGNNNNDINETSPPSYASATANNNNNNNNTLPPPSSSIPSYYIPSSPSPHHTRIPSPLPLTHTTSAMSPPLPTATSMVAGTSDCKGTICGCSGCRYCVSKPDFAYLFSWPLVGQIGNEPPFVIKKLDFDAEWQLFKKTLDSARRSIAIRSETATSENLRQVINLGARAVHYTGHGLPTCLAFEDGQGRMHSLDAPTLKALVGAGGGAVGVKFVFVSACHSEIAGQAFVDAGVPHVIAVRLDAQVADRASRTFMSQFYSALLCGKTVQAAYEIGKAAVKADPLITRSDEPKKFLLLPDNGDHNVAIFDAATTPTGGWIDVSPEPKLYSIPNCPESFLGRQKEMQQVVALLAKKNLLVL